MYDLKLCIEFIREYGYLPQCAPKNLVLEKAQLKCQIDDTAQELKGYNPNEKASKLKGTIKNQDGAEKTDKKEKVQQTKTFAQVDPFERLQIFIMSAFISILCSVMVNYVNKY